MTGQFCSEAGACPFYRRDIDEPVLSYDPARDRPYKCDALTAFFDNLRSHDVGDNGLIERFKSFGLECPHLIRINQRPRIDIED